VFVNLVQNAYDAMSESGGTLRISIAAAWRGERRGVEVRVADSGPGIPLQLREQIFNPFFTTKKTGVGLGLSIVSKIVDEHHGSIEICDGDQNDGSAAGGEPGACFAVFVPLAEQAVIPEPQAASRA
jgi:signal transduction histidine kinase